MSRLRPAILWASRTQQTLPAADAAPTSGKDDIVLKAASATVVAGQVSVNIPPGGAVAVSTVPFEK